MIVSQHNVSSSKKEKIKVLLNTSDASFCRLDLWTCGKIVLNYLFSNEEVAY
jgi:hypothetical protein